ncbi:MAG: hypothetical protein FJ265_10420 [Planctomycetes bacterium]|nr:hypothetical protein [Planctomycetota bacterium]
MKSTILLAAATLPFLAAPAAAQTPDHLVGLTRMSISLRHVDHWACFVMGQCPVPMPSVILPPVYAGGTGWDPVRSGAWVTDGKQLAEVDDQCRVLCPVQNIPTLGANAFATGLDVVESQNQLWILDSQGFLHFYSNSCPPMPLGLCNTGLAPLPPQTFTSGLAVDEGSGFVFMAHCDFSTGANFVAVSRLANPCQVICRLTVPPCPAGPFGTITGLGVNWAREILYATDGNNTVAIRYVTVGTICPQFTSINCCYLPNTLDPMVGLAVRPGRETPLGQPCGNGACPSCPNVHSLGNDPNLGNAAFRLDLTQAPGASLMWCIIGMGPCSVPGVIAPPLCGPIYSVPVLGTLGPNPILGVTACGGQTSYAFPLPLMPSLAGWTISSQCAGLCVTAALIGTAVSNCISFTLQGS